MVSDEMTLSQYLTNLIVDNPISALNLVLLCITIVLSVSSYSSQARMSVRESIEQLDDLEVNHSTKIKPSLHDFDFGILNPRSTVQFRVLSPAQNPSTASKYITSSSLFHESRNSEMESFLEQRDLVSRAEFNEPEVIVGISSRNAVEVKQATEEIMLQIRDLQNAVSSSEIDELLTSNATTDQSD